MGDVKMANRPYHGSWRHLDGPGRQSSVCTGIRWQITFPKIEFYTICEFGWAEARFAGKKITDKSMAELDKFTECLLAKLHP